MSRNDDIDKTLESWLRRQAPRQAPDRVLDAALERVAEESQRRSWLQRLTGETPMTTLTRAAALTAVIAMAALIGFQFNTLVGNLDPTPSPSPSPTTTATASNAATPTPEPTPTLPAYCVNPLVDINTLIDLQSTGPLDPPRDPVACYGDAPLTFDATWLGGGVADCPTAPEPAWLACSAFSLQAPGDTRKVGAPSLGVAVDPSASLSLPSEPYAQVRVTGHFDDPAAQTCRETEPLPGASAEPDSQIIERCRNTFVITEVVAVEP
ncbi:MAG TPA: hypothetical protein VFH90_11405 [Candidatus Limnocylindria bacterium]|nr:hypothetical protein [Candidatus Limnocylindria bacterium]